MKRKHAVAVLGALTVIPVGQARAQGGELGNAFVPFASQVGRFTLEYANDWRINDQSAATSFADAGPAVAAPAGSFFTVEVDGAGAASVGELAARLKSLHPETNWQPTILAGYPGWSGQYKDVRWICLLRGPRDQLNLRLRSMAGDHSDAILGHMLQSFRADYGFTDRH